MMDIQTEIASIVKELEQRKISGQATLDTNILREYLLAILNPLAPIIAHVLWNTPDVENYLMIPVNYPNDSKHNFNIVFQKAGKKLPEVEK